MAVFLNDQLDFIFFFYGLAFILLSATCWIALGRGAGAAWAVLGGFGLLHGASEWLDLTALIIGDSPGFSTGRMAVMTVSFFLLLEFARMEGSRLGFRLPGRWIYVILTVAIALISIADGPKTGGIVARYSVGFVGAAGAGFVLARRARLAAGVTKGLMISASTGFVLYAICSGLVVPAGNIWPSTVVNYATFTEVTQMPVQLVRGFLACWISFSVWAIWSQQVAADMASPKYSAFVREQLTWTLVMMGAILVSGWTLTEYLGGIYRENVEREARTDIDMLTSRLKGDTATVEAVTRSLAGSRSILPLLTGGSEQQWADARATLALDIEASGAESGSVSDAGGAIVAFSKGRNDNSWADHHNTASPFHLVPGAKPAGHFSCPIETNTCTYSASYPITSDDGRVVGAAALTKSLANFEADLRQFDRPYYFVDPDGVIQMSNRPESLHRPLWPLPAKRRTTNAQRIGSAKASPMLDQAVIDSTWMTVNGERDYVRRRLVNDSGWSLVIFKTQRQIFATRFLGIVITLLVTITALVYLLGKTRRVHDEVERDSRTQLQELAEDLGHKATTDALTGLNNRHRLEDALIDEMQRANRYDTPLTAIMFDIDHFKAVNDTYGHSRGDEVLIQLSRIVSNGMRSSDLLVRWGGEEFLVLMPSTNETKGRQAAENCRRTIENQKFDEVGTVTCSFGVAQYDPGETGGEFLARVDAALYRAKKNGRNRVEIASTLRTSGEIRQAFAA